VQSSVGNLDISTIPLDDKKTYAMLAKGDAAGVFQFESVGMRESLRPVKPTVFEDLIRPRPLYYRPGPMGYIPVYGKRKAGQEQVTYVDKRLEPILHDTYGICIFPGVVYAHRARDGRLLVTEADDLRKAIGKKIRSLMDSLKDRFMEGLAENTSRPAAAKQLWEDVEKAAELFVPESARSVLRR